MNNQPESNFTPTRRAKGQLDLKAPRAAEMIKTATYDLCPMSPESYCLSVLISTYWDSTTANGVLHPETERTCVSLGVAKDQLLEIADGMVQTVSLEQLEAGKRPDWAVHYDTSSDEQRILSYQPLFLDSVRANRAELNNVRISINHVKTIARYTPGLRAGLAKAMSIWATGLTESVYYDFGYGAAERVQRGSAPYQIFHTGRDGMTKATKLQHNAQFTHQMLRNRSRAGAAQLVEVKELSEDFVSDSFETGLNFEAINEKFLLNGDYAAILDAVREINAFGWHSVRILARGSDRSQWRVLFTPTLAFHQFVWSMDFFAAGPLLTRWEVENGWIPFADDAEQGDDPMKFVPPLGYHYLYGLRSARTGEFITVGQTTQSLTSRLHQHERAGSNGDANDGILDILTDPDDHLEIVHFATVHHRITSEKEMSLAHAMLAKDHRIRNKILTISGNNRTVKLDSRFGSPEFIQRNYWAVQEKLDLVREAHEGKEILFMIDQLPEVRGSTTIDAEAVRWLFETPEFPAGDGISNNADDADYTMLMWEADERGAYDEIAA